MKQEVAELTEKIDQCNLNLKSARDNTAAKEKANKKLQKSLKQVRGYMCVCMHNPCLKGIPMKAGTEPIRAHTCFELFVFPICLVFISSFTLGVAILP